MLKMSLKCPAICFKLHKIFIYHFSFYIFLFYQNTYIYYVADCFYILIVKYCK